MQELDLSRGFKMSHISSITLELCKRHNGSNGFYIQINRCGIPRNECFWYFGSLEG